MSYAKYVMLLEKKLFLALISDQLQQILDIGTGTGELLPSSSSNLNARRPIKAYGQ
jgi:hypothetical protein